MTCSVLHKIQKPPCRRGTYCVKNRLCKKTFSEEEEKKRKGENCVNCYLLLTTSKAYYNKTDTCFWKQFRQSLGLDHGHGRKQAWEVRTNGTVSPGFLEQRYGRQTQRKKMRL